MNPSNKWTGLGGVWLFQPARLCSQRTTRTPGKARRQPKRAGPTRLATKEPLMKMSVLILFCAGMVRAQIGPPQLGLVQDGSRLRPVYGIPAAAAVLPPLDYGREFARVAVSPRQDYAIASDSNTGVVLLVVASEASPLP